MTVIEVGYDPNPKQLTFHRSKAKIRGYGGAVGGGKSRAICEEALHAALHHPGLVTLICRDAHTSIIQTTKHTMMEQVLHPDLIESGGKKASGGEDYVRLKNGSVFHFIGLEDPVRWFSSEVGLLIFDEAHEIAEWKVRRLILRLRQRCKDCIKAEVEDCEHMPKCAILAFNPSNPGHWLFQWFITGAAQTEHGFYKEHLRLEDARKALGDAEFIFATAKDNPFVGQSYLDMLEGLPDRERQRYLEGKWVYIEGNCFFDNDALAWYEDTCRNTVARRVGRLACCAEAPDCKCEGIGARPVFLRDKAGQWTIWKTPVRERVEKGRRIDGHRYIVAVDVSSGAAQDFSAIQVFSVEDFEQVAEWQAKKDPDLVALEAVRIARIYNDALVAAETTGGWGVTINQELKRLKYGRLYTERRWDRLAQKFTDKVGWDTNTKTRPYMLDTLEKALRERVLGLNGLRTHHQLASFVISKDKDDRPKRAEAQSGANDDLVIALAIAVTIATQMPRQLRRVREPEYVPSYEATGW